MAQCVTIELLAPLERKARARPERPVAPARPSDEAVLQADRMTSSASRRSWAISLILARMKQAEALGWAVEPIELDLVLLEPHFLVFLRSLLLTRLDGHAKRAPEKLDPTLLGTIEAGRAYNAADLCQAQFARTDYFTRVHEILSRFDLIASPTLSAPALPAGIDPIGAVEIACKPAGTIRGAWYPYTFPFDLTGHPAISLPCGWSSQGLPIGLQLVGRWHDDRHLLDVGTRLQIATDEPSSFASGPPVA